MASFAVIARRYAKALFGIARQHGTVTSLQDELARLHEVTIECVELMPVLHAAEFPPRQRKAVVDAVGRLMGLSATVVNLLKLLIDKQRIIALHEVIAAYHRLVDDDAGVITATVTTATPLIDCTILSNIERVIGRLKGRRVRVESAVDGGLIGGVMIRVGDEVFDGSVTAELRRMREQLLR